MNVRMGDGFRIGGGLSLGRTATNNCDVVMGRPPLQNYRTGSTVTLPRGETYCDVTPPFQPNARGYAVYPLPWNLQASATFQTQPGPQVLAVYAAPNAVIVPSLGRNLSAGANGTVMVDLVPPGTMYGDRLYQLDLRLTRIFRFGTRRLQGNFDLYNLLNASPVLLQNDTYGSAWQRPIAVLPGRLFKFGAQLDF
jgi:hypothetical protein